jgi:hypothetical protein
MPIKHMQNQKKRASGALCSPCHWLYKDEKNYQLVNVDTQRPQWQEGKTSVGYQSW